MQRYSILLLTMYTVFIGGTAYTANVPILTMVFHLIVGLTLGIWLFVKFRKGHLWPKTALDTPLLMYVLLLGLATLAAVDVRVSASQAWQMVLHVLVFYMLVDMIRRGKQRWVIEAMFLAGGVVVMVSVLELASWYFGLGFAGYEFGWFGLGGIVPPVTYKLSLAMNVSTILGNYALTLIPIIFAWGLSTSQRDYKMGLFALATGMLFVLLGTQSRGAWGAFVAAVGVMVAFELMRRPQTQRLFPQRLTFGAIALGAVAMIVLLMGYATVSNSTSDMRREDMWRQTLDITNNDPITGAGVGLFGVEYRETRDTTFIQDKIVAAHNLVLNTLAEVGVVGVVLLVWVAVTFLQIWYRGWSTASPAQKRRYEGILAALVGFGVHSSIDMFSTAAPVSTVLIIAAYVVGMDKETETPSGIQAAAYRHMRVAVALFTFVSVGWLLSTDIGLLRMLGAWRFLGDDDYVAALERLEDAEAIDPGLGVYELQQAYVLGLLADEDPTNYLERAIIAHETMLEDNPTYDMGYANLAVLLLQAGEPEDALPYIQRASDINPDIWEYQWLHGRVLEALDDFDGAASRYASAIDEEPTIGASRFWQTEPAASRRNGLNQALQRLQPDERMLILLAHSRTDDAAQLAENYTCDDEGLMCLALARYEAAQGSQGAAISHFDRAVDLLTLDNGLAQAYAERAAVYLAQGDLDAAEDDARRALFLDRSDGAYAFYVLAQVLLQQGDAEDSQINNYLIRSVPPRVVVQGYASAVYYSPAQLDLLPQMQLPGIGDARFAPWLLLAERYATDDDDETLAQDVYDAILEREPYTQILAAND